MTAPKEHLSTLRARLRSEAAQRGINPRDVDVLLSDVIGQPLSFVLAHGEAPVDPSLLDALLRRRFAGEPLQYIRRKCEFFGHQFYVDDRVLIPRPETELLVEAAIALAPRGARVADIGAGTGCIAISLAFARPDLRIVAVDVSMAALAVAACNRDALRVPIDLVASDLLNGVEARFDVVVSNPPYVSALEVEQLAPAVRDHEPRIALTPGPRGTETIERILSQAGDARLMMEIGLGQEPLVRDLAASRGFAVDEVRNDLAGIPRVVVLSRHGWK